MPTGANSYATVAQAKLYCASRGLDISNSDNDTISAWLINACDYIEKYRAQFIGRRIVSTQPLSWPREEYRFNGFWFRAASIPNLLVMAQCQLVLDQASGSTLFQTIAGGAVAKLIKVGPIETTYDTTTAETQTFLPAFQALIAQLLSYGNGMLIAERG